MASCKGCKESTKETKNNKNVLEQLAEAGQGEIIVGFAQSIIKRLWIAIIILIMVSIIAPLCVHFGWLYYESRWETVDYAYEYSQDGQGTNIIGNQNEVLNGTETISESENTP